MRLLIIGGTIFLGRHLVEAARVRGHTLTTFSRGRHNPEIHPDVEKLRGDRNGDVRALRGRTWDAVIDTCGYVPGGVRRVIEVIGENISHYTFISSVSAYAELPPAGIDERAPVATISPDQVADAEAMATGERATGLSYGEMYGPLKALCEATAERMMPGRVLNVRPGLIVGPHDDFDRFTYWVARVAQGGAVLAPGSPDRRVRVIDACDLAGWIIRMIEGQQVGLYNATGAEDGLTMGRMLDGCRNVSRSDATFVWASEKFLIDRQVAAWSELPLWVPAHRNGIFEVRNDKAITAGLTFRPLASTIGDTLEWDANRGTHIERRTGLRHERELELLRDLDGLRRKQVSEHP
jgi:2'-hydroxyisoflavone reductase